MALLMLVSTFRDRTTFSDTTDGNNAIDMALRVATQVVAADLRTELTYTTSITDTFRVRRSHIIPGEPHPAVFQSRYRQRVSDIFYTKFLLRQGFLTDASAVTAYSASSIPRLSVVADRDDLRSADADSEDHLEIDTVRGVVDIWGLDLSMKYVNITYDAGFDVDTDELFDGTPEWLKELGYLQAAVALDTNMVLRPQEQFGASTTMLQRQIRTILEPRVRYEPLAVRPITT